MAHADLSGILRAISGTLGNFTFRTTKDGIIISNRPISRDTPPTAEQILVRSFFSTASKRWNILTDAQRTSWNAYAAMYYKKAANNSVPSGQTIFLKASWYVQAFSGTLGTSAPSASPSPGPTGIALIASPDDTTLTVRVEHSLPVAVGYHMFIEITPTLSSPARSPQPSDYRAVKGLNDASFPALEQSSVNYTFGDIRFALANGARFGCRARVVSPDGIPSHAFETVLVQVIS